VSGGGGGGGEVRLQKKRHEHKRPHAPSKPHPTHTTAPTHPPPTRTVVAVVVRQLAPHHQLLQKTLHRRLVLCPVLGGLQGGALRGELTKVEPGGQVGESLCFVLGRGGEGVMVEGRG